MLDKDTLEAIGQMLDNKLDAKLDEKFVPLKQTVNRLEEKLDAHDKRFDGIEEKLGSHGKRFDGIEEKLGSHDKRFDRLETLLEHDIPKQMKLLAEGQADILSKLVPHSRIDEMEDELRLFKTIVCQMNEDIQNLKKAQ